MKENNDYVPASKEMLQVIHDALARDYACRAAYGQGLIEQGLIKSLREVYFGNTSCDANHKVLLRDYAELLDGGKVNPPVECWACKIQDTYAGVMPEDTTVRAKVVRQIDLPGMSHEQKEHEPFTGHAAIGPDHIQSDYDSKIAERMGRS